MRGFRLKPNLKTINLRLLKPEQVEYFCTTKHIDRKRCEIAGIEFDETLAEMMEEGSKFYFLVKTNQEYDVISSVLLDPFIEEHKLIHKSYISDKAAKCIDHFIKSLK